MQNRAFMHAALTSLQSPADEMGIHYAPDRAPSKLTITHNFRALREQPKGQVGDNKKGAADNTL